MANWPSYQECHSLLNAILRDVLDRVMDSKMRVYLGGTRVEERYYCNFGINSAYRWDLENAGLIATGIEAGEEQSRGESRILELPGHPFFLATLFMPQARSTQRASHPLIDTFVRVVAGSHSHRSLQSSHSG